MINVGGTRVVKITLEQALQKAIEAHKEGKLQASEALYKAILQIQPKHPDANHNLGVLAVSVNKIEIALPLFKTALEINPTKSQFWLSYIDALVKAKKFSDARNIISQGRKAGLEGESIEALETQLAPSLLAQSSELPSTIKISNLTEPLKILSKKKEKKKNSQLNQRNLSKVQSPAQAELKTLLEYYQKGQYDRGEKLAKAITKKYPHNQFAWKVFGAILKQTGRLQGSLIAFQRSVEISPSDAQAHFNLGNTLKDLDRLEESIISYHKAIDLKHDHAEAYSNLGITLHVLGRLEEAEKSYKIAISIKSEYAEAHNNLGNTLKELGRLEEAEKSYNKAIAIKPEFTGAYNNLGNILQELGRFEEAEKSYKKAIAIKSNYVEAHSNLGITLQSIGRLRDAEVSYRKAIEIEPKFVEAHFNLGNALRQLGRLKDSEASYIKVIAIKPEYVEAHNNLGIAIQELGRFEEAETSYRKAIAINPGHAEANSNLGILLYASGRYDEAAKILELITFKHSQSYLLRCLYLQNEKVKFYELLDRLTSEGITNPMIGSLSCQAEIKYGLKKPNSFCGNPFQYVSIIDLENQYDFLNNFIRPVSTIFNQKIRSEKSQKLLTNGRQTLGNLFELERGLTNEIEEIIHIEVEKYRAYFKDSEEGFLKKWPAEYSLNGWLINMKSGGKLRPHMHENGWISGSIYINVPPKSNTNSGNLVVCIDDHDYLVDGKTSHEKIIDVNTGSMCLFPASLLHYTIPFESEEERIVLAFDVIPKSH